MVTFASGMRLTMSKSVLADTVTAPGLLTSAGCSLSMPMSRSNAVTVTPVFVALTNTFERMGMVALRSTMPCARCSAFFSSSAAMRNSIRGTGVARGARAGKHF